MNKFKKGDYVEVASVQDPQFWEDMRQLLGEITGQKIPKINPPQLGDVGIIDCNEVTGTGPLKAYSVKFFGRSMPFAIRGVFPYSECRLKKIPPPKTLVEDLLKKVGAQNA